MMLHQCRHHPIRMRSGAPVERRYGPTRPALVAAAAATSITTSSPALLASAAAAAAAALVLVLASPSAANAEDLTLRFKASADPQIRAAQQQLVEAWALTSSLYVDGAAIVAPQWHDAIGKALDASFSEPTADGVRALEDELLARLGDPYTRVLRGAAAERLAAEEEGMVVSNGLALLPSSAGWSVAYVAPVGPAEAAGVRVGDAVLEVDDAPPPDASSSDKSAREAFLARVSRQPVALRLSRDGGDAGGNKAAAAAAIINARLSPAPINVDSVQWGVLRVPVGGSEGDGQQKTEVPVAYLRIAQFSQRTPDAVADAMRGMFGGGSGSGGTGIGSSYYRGPPPRALLVDLRDDTGGVVEAGVEVARQLLRPGDALAEVTSRTAGGGTAAIETSTERVVLSAPASSSLPPLYAAASKQRLPMAVLTTHNTASTAELLAGALRDGGPGATIVGERTFGKGRTQRVMALQNGAAEEVEEGEGGGGGRKGVATLLVSTMRFATPTGAAIDGVGLEPGVACAAPASGFEVFRAGAAGPDGAGEEMSALLEGDECVRRAADLLAAQAGGGGKTSSR